MKEIILNLWYLTDENGLIFSLKAKPYVHLGDDKSKTEFLKERASFDFEVAKDYFLSENTKFVSPHGTLNVAPVSLLNSAVGINQIYGGIFDQIDKELSQLSNLRLPENPLYVITALYLSEDRKVSLFNK